LIAQAHAERVGTNGGHEGNGHLEACKLHRDVRWGTAEMWDKCSRLPQRLTRTRRKQVAQDLTEHHDPTLRCTHATLLACCVVVGQRHPADVSRGAAGGENTSLIATTMAV
jgi:hypothetical protein